MKHYDKSDWISFLGIRDKYRKIIRPMLSIYKKELFRTQYIIIFFGLTIQQIMIIHSEEIKLEIWIYLKLKKLMKN